LVNLLVLLILLCSSDAFANRKVSAHTFQVQIRPQLVGIQQDFQQILENFPGYPSEVFELTNSLDRAHELLRSAQALCPTRTNSQCALPLQGLLREVRIQERVLLKLQERLKFLPQNDASPLGGFSFLVSFEQPRAHLQHKLEVALLSVVARTESSSPLTSSFVKGLDEMWAYHDLMVVEFIPPRFKEDFRSAWMNFFRPLHRYGRAGIGHTFISANIESLNFYWNLLNMRMTKRTKNLPDGMGAPLNAVQNRWNQVMRICQGL
jgi:hypothetical protein